MSSTAKKKIGRPSKLTQNAHDESIKAIESGLPFKYAAALCRVGYSTFENWLTKGKADDREGVDTKERRLFLGVHAAKAKNAGQMMGVVTRAALEDNDVSAAQWVLKNHHKVGHVQQVEVKADVKTNAMIDLSGMTPEQLAALVADD